MPASLFNWGLFVLLLKSLALSGATAFGATINGGLLAFVLTKTNVRGKTGCKLLLLLPLFLPPYLLAVAWVDLFVACEMNTNLIFNYFGVFWVMLFIFTPLSMLIISIGLSNVSSSIEEAALLMAGPFHTLKSIILPLLRPSLLSSFILIFVLALSEFSIASFLSVKVFTTEIFTQFAAFYNHGAAVLLSLVPVLICLVLLFMEGKYLTHAPFISVGLRPSVEIRIKELKQSKLLLEGSLILYLFISTLLPLILLFTQASAGGKDTILKAHALLLPTVSSSILYALTGASALCLMGFFLASLGPAKLGATEKILFLTFVLPSTVIGIALIKLFNHKAINFIYSSPLMIILVYLFKFLFISEKLISNTLKQLPGSLMEAAKVMGATKRDAVIRIIFPLSFKALFAAFVICFILCLSELGGAILVYPPGTSLMPIKVFTIMANAPQSLVSAMCAEVLIITLLAVFSIFLVKVMLELIFRKKGWKL